MSRFGVAISLLLVSSSVNGFHNFQPQSSIPVRNTNHNAAFSRKSTEVRRGISASSTNPDYSKGGDTLGDALSSVTSAARDSIAKVVSDEPDIDEASIALKQRQVGQRTNTYSVVLPLASASMEGKSQMLSIGMTVSQINKGRRFESGELNIDTMTIDNPSSSQEGVMRMDEPSLAKRVDGEFHGLLVSSVVEGSAAWAGGVRAGDILKSTSATLGEQLWPKSTLEGVRSAILSRKATSRSVQLEFQRISEAVDNVFELTLTKPIGLEMKETEDGYVEVTGFTPNAPTLVQYAVKAGDRVVAVDSSIGDKMWPVSTVEGVVSAVTSRLPGQQITFRFERPLVNMESQALDQPRTATLQQPAATAISSPKVVENAELLQRCRDVIKRYTGDEQAGEKFVSKYAVPGLVADKVVDALASAGAMVDRITLSMIMGAYLSCRQPQKAIGIFEASVGLRANGSSGDTTVTMEGNEGRQLAPNVEALDVYTVSALLKAHAMTGDFESVKRVLAAVEGRESTVLDGESVAQWPGTGEGGVLIPDTQCYNIAISALADSKGRGSLELALQLFYSMSEPGKRTGQLPQRDLVSYNAVINALSNSGRYEEAIDLFSELKKFGLRPDKYTYTSLVKAVVAHDNVEELIYDMRDEGVEADVVTFNKVIESLCEQRKIVAAKKIVSLMELSGVSPNSMTYGLLMKGLIETRKPGAALTLFESARSDQKTLALTENVYLFTTAISAAASMGDHERALELLSAMNNVGVKPTLKTLTALMGACLAAGKPNLAVDIYNRIESPDGYARSQGLRALCEDGRVEEALSYVSSLDRHSRRLSGKQLMLVYKTMMETSIDQGNYELARRVLTVLLGSSHIPSKAIYQAIFVKMELLPKKFRRALPGLSLDETSTEKFQFLLFLLDSVLKRKLPCEGYVYAAILSYGSRLGGLPRKVCSLLVLANSLATDPQAALPIDESGPGQAMIDTWEELFLRYDELRDNRSIGPSSLPPISVRVSTKDFRKVLMAEKNLSYKRRARDTR